MRRIPLNYYFFGILCFGLTFWILIKTIGLPEVPSSTNTRFNAGINKQEGDELSSKLETLEKEIISQRAISSILLDKVKSTFQKPNQSQGAKPENDNTSHIKKDQIIHNNAHYDYNEVADQIRDRQEKAKKPVKDNTDPKVESHPYLLVRPAEEHVGEVKSEEVNEGDHAIVDENGAHEEIDPKDPVIAVLVFVCNRPTVKRNVDQLLRYRPSETKFPIVVSQDCGHHQATTDVLEAYGDQITHIYQPDLTEIKVPPKEAKLSGYYKIARHYGFALNYTFYTLKHTNVIIVEDDLDISPDFFDYFSATLPVLRKDPTLWCVSAWNDNGKPKRINETAHELLYRTDFFPGLGWMLTKEVWDELSVKWAKSYWDDWMREPAQRKDRACIRPEISRTSTFGKNGVSHGTYYQTHLRYIKLNDVAVPFTKMDLTYLIKEKYDHDFVNRVYSSQVVATVDELNKLTKDSATESSAEFRLTYRTQKDFTMFAKRLEIMDDLRAGVPRTAYRGVVTFMYNNHRAYLAPGANWVGYQPKATA